jgi:hypothetical protein
MQTPLYSMLEQEGYLIRSALASGLTGLRNANLQNRGDFYTGFFQLAIGLERLAKLGLVLDHMGHNNLASPGQKHLKSFGHNIVQLRSKLDELSVTRAYTLDAPFTPTALGERILNFLSDFGVNTRYANLDALAAGAPQPTPFSEWEQILNDVLIEKVPQIRKERVFIECGIMERLIGSATVAICTDLSACCLKSK